MNKGVAPVQALLLVGFSISNDGPGIMVDAQRTTYAKSSVTGTIIPLYTYPSDPSWQRIIAVQRTHPSVPMVAIVNPNSGPGTSIDPVYESGTRNLQAVGIMVAGYVATGYAKNDPETVVKPQIERYASWYPAVTGIFFDEQSNQAGDEDYYKELDIYAKDKGFAFTIGNPGAEIPESYIDTLDTVLIYESKGLPDISSLAGSWQASYDRRRLGIIPYGVLTLDASFVQSAKKFVGWIFVTNDDLPNPWDSRPSYFESLVAELDR